jgi:hypothetical protein
VGKCVAALVVDLECALDRSAPSSAGADQRAVDVEQKDIAPP